MTELRKILQKLGETRSAEGTSSRRLSRIPPFLGSLSPTLLDYGFAVVRVPDTMLSRALERTPELRSEDRTAMYPDTGESGETYDVELGAERVLKKSLFDLDRILKTIQ